MPRKTKPRIAAVIDIGSNELKLAVAQATYEDILSTAEPQILRYLEVLNYPLGLGRDTFQTGKMSFDKTDKACEIIKNFLHVVKSYGVNDVKAVATTAVREAANADFILDQIKIKTGLAVNVMDDREEKAYIYKLLLHYSPEGLQQSAMMVFIGAGNIGVSELSSGRIPFTQNIKVGSLRMGELFEGMEGYTHDFYKLMEEYLAGFTNLLVNDIPRDIQNFIAAGHEIGLMAELTGVNTDALFFDIPRKNLLSLYDEIKHKSADRIAIDFRISSEQAEVLLPAACIYQNLLGLTAAGHITAARVLPCDAILYEMLYPKTFSQLEKNFAKNTLLSARTLARRYKTGDEHFDLVYDFAMTIFDKMKKLHGMDGRDKLLLQTAVILHDTGKYINNREHYRHSFEIVMGSDIVGLNQQEIEIVALICLYHARQMPSIREPRYTALTMENRVRVSKLSAILRLADALDSSHTKKFSRIAVKITDEALVVTVETDLDVALEQWSFNDKGRFFEEVFGIKAKIKVKRLAGN